MERSGYIIQVPSLERGDRIVVVEVTGEVPFILPVTYKNEDQVVTRRYVDIEELPIGIRAKIEAYLESVMD